ncbi:hypothetical protein [Variovorax sp.]|uniref:hypothetical protein n=1 Tax=Variovorax sp. TaxID=1871043 RepID=UPI003BA85366
MNTAPSALTPEATAWMQAQIAIHTARAVAPLREELDKLDDWANGLFVVLADVLPQLLRAHPSAAAAIAPRWERAAESFDAVLASGQRKTNEGESLELLEARKMLYRVFAVVGLWPKARAKMRR